jgi:hypothetical protein
MVSSLYCPKVVSLRWLVLEDKGGQRDSLVDKQRQPGVLFSHSLRLGFLV